MRCHFDWKYQPPKDIQKLAEAKILEDLSSSHSPIRLCHSGPADVTLSPNLLEHTFVGNVKCSCGIPAGVVQGMIDGSSITFAAVPR